MGTLGTGDKGGWIRLGGHGVEEESAKKKQEKEKRIFFLFLTYSYGPFIHS